jgi:NAD+ synthase (glutamine-hydrolysing)
MYVTVGMAQMYPRIGNVAANLKTHLETLELAKAQGVELLMFPELSLTGYNLQDLVYEVAMRPTGDDPTFGQLLQASGDYHIDIMVGFVDTDERARYFIAAAYLSEGKVVHIHHKVYLPTYTMFDEGRYFAWHVDLRGFLARIACLSAIAGSRRFVPVPQCQPWTWPRFVGSAWIGALGTVGKSGLWQHLQ